MFCNRRKKIENFYENEGGWNSFIIQIASASLSVSTPTRGRLWELVPTGVERGWHLMQMYLMVFNPQDSPLLAAFKQLMDLSSRRLE
jgi:hypothetical protein